MISGLAEDGAIRPPPIESCHGLRLAHGIADRTMPMPANMLPPRARPDLRPHDETGRPQLACRSSPPSGTQYKSKNGDIVRAMGCERAVPVRLGDYSGPVMGRPRVLPRFRSGMDASSPWPTSSPRSGQTTPVDNRDWSNQSTRTPRRPLGSDRRAFECDSAPDVAAARAEITPRTRPGVPICITSRQSCTHASTTVESKIPEKSID